MPVKKSDSMKTFNIRIAGDIHLTHFNDLMKQDYNT